jgi:hypothetical protein
MRNPGITVLAIFALLIAFLSVVATRVENGVEAQYSHLPKTSDYGADFTASVKSVEKPQVK